MVAGAAPAGAGNYTNIGGVGGSNGGPSNRFSSVIDRLFELSRRHINEPVELRNLCIFLSRVIDHAIWNHEIPSRSQELPLLMKQLYQNKNDTHLLAAVMVLMISVKSACQNGWFSDGDSKVLSYLAKEIAGNFGSVSDSITEPSSSLSVISTIISRFYPKMKVGHIFVTLEVKPGFDAYVSDFQISNNLKPSPGETIRLFVVQTNSIETSNCLISPPKVDFLLNGKGVEKRSDPFVDTVPQLPTILSNMVKYGPNLLQAVGEFNGNYIITVAFMSGLLSPDSNTLQDYEQCAPANVDADSDDVIEGSSRISLNCPISFKRIKIPVKGHSCKHFQCFDFDNYVDINSRRPSWRCPHCYQHVCFPDIRIDQKMVKVLQEVGPNVSDVVFCSDGSWSAVTESEDAKRNTEDNTGQNESGQAVDVLDLTQIDDAMDDIPTYETEKHSSTAHETQMSNSNRDYWSGVFMSTFGLGPSNVQPSELTAGASLPSPDGLVEALNQFGNPSMSNEHGRFPLIRTPNAVMSCTNDVSSFVQNALSAASQISPNASNLTTRSTPRQQNLAFPAGGPPPHQNAGFLDPNQVPNMYRVSNAAREQQMGNIRFNRGMSQSPGTIQSSSSFSHPQSVHNRMGGQQSDLIAAANIAARMSIDPSRTAPSWNPDGRSSMLAPPGPGPGPGDQRGITTTSQQPVNYDPSDPSWHPPAGRMRGALTGQAYKNAFNQFIGRPNPQPQPARPHVPPHVQAPMASGPVLGVPVQNSASTLPSGQPMG